MTRAATIQIAPADPAPGVRLRPEPASGPSTRDAMFGLAWSVGGYGLSQVLRLASNVILARLLVPEAFGVMAIINALSVALQMFSDVGIGPAVIQKADGERERFRNTAFTIQAVRGVALWLVACALAWPLSLLYGAPELAWLVPVAATATILSGLNSTRLLTLNRKLRLARLTMLDLAAYGCSLATMIAWALWRPSVWALVAGVVVYAAVRAVLSHVALPGPGDRFAWDGKVARELVRFGKWIFLSTIIGFVVNYGDRLILGGFLTMRELGLYAIAATLARFVIQGHQTVGRQVLFPYYARVAEHSRERLRREVLKLRLITIAGGIPVLASLVLFGPQLVGLLYDPRYAEAGWMLQALAAGAAFAILPAVGPVDLAMGNSRLFASLVGVRAMLMLASMTVGGVFWGSQGLILGTAAASAAQYPVIVWLCRRYGVWFPGLDALAFASFGLICGLGLWLTGA